MSHFVVSFSDQCMRSIFKLAVCTQKNLGTIKGQAFVHAVTENDLLNPADDLANQILILCENLVL